MKNIRDTVEGGAITSNGLLSLGANFGASALALSPSLLGFLNTNSTSYDRNGNQQNGAAHMPSILCTNNKEASIYVGQTMSILTQAQQSTTGSSNVLNNYSRLSSNNKVTLEVETEIEDILPGFSCHSR